MSPRVYLLAGVPLLAACAGTPKLQTLHDPLYRAENHTSTITARAIEARDGIAEITVSAIIGELTACDGAVFQLPSLIPCRRNATQVAVQCSFANVKSQVSCALPIAITPRRLISYSATAKSAKGRTASSPVVAYAGGAPVTEARLNLPFAAMTIPWETARPVVWRTETPGASAERDDKIDLGYVPNDDYGNYRQFTDDLPTVIIPAFIDDSNAYSAWTRTWRNIFNLWAGPTGASANGCSRSFGAPASTVRGAFDGTAILHRNDFRDCASISLGGGAGTTQTTLGDAAWVGLHEAGHYLFGLGDEYEGGGNVAISTPRNVFPTLAACQSTSTSEGLPAGNCGQIGATGTYRNDDAQATTMEDRTLSSDWRTLSGRALGNRLSACINGNCY